MMPPIIEVQKLRKYFGKGADQVRAVDGISINIQEGEIFGFLGPNGAGKTTSLRIIIGLLKPDSGGVKILGKDPFSNGKQLKRQLGIVTQDVVMYEDLTVEENLWFLANIYEIPKTVATKRINYLISQMGLEDKRNAQAKTLSGGLRGRLNLILGLIHDPTIVLCDEPTPGLDPQSRVAVWEFIQKLPEQGKTVILTTHFMEEADRLCDRVAIIDHGKILVLDTPETLKASIGEGDSIEVELVDPSLLDSTSNAFTDDEGIEYSRVLGGAIVIRGKALVSKLNRILSKIESLAEIRNVKLRRTTLEDVFIHLTGRRLRN
ncbi:MAG: ATP-binding cassette domain-containing protein [Candidatus Heimdallarchaeota archaeon]